MISTPLSCYTLVAVVFKVPEAAQHWLQVRVPLLQPPLWRGDYRQLAAGHISRLAPPLWLPVLPSLLLHQSAPAPRSPVCCSGCSPPQRRDGTPQPCVGSCSWMIAVVQASVPPAPSVLWKSAATGKRLFFPQQPVYRKWATKPTTLLFIYFILFTGTQCSNGLLYILNYFLTHNLPLKKQH